ncbi:hypothetical protein BZG36_01010 [Bifiguratus adelaidae]|uniref:Bacteriophage T5 Orf172 DNA-binding domain-containing protein n=1 Tax=Bifiguratus adelaidae TaxID=1938954 RepID=A0A261Y6C7_9FUNG|nr:hypothetical protein BZG36_01010 [Bifiguratus adelaidae]
MFPWPLPTLLLQALPGNLVRGPAVEFHGQQNGPDQAVRRRDLPPTLDIESEISLSSDEDACARSSPRPIKILNRSKYEVDDDSGIESGRETRLARGMAHSASKELHYSPRVVTDEGRSSTHFLTTQSPPNISRRPYPVPVQIVVSDNDKEDRLPHSLHKSDNNHLPAEEPGPNVFIHGNSNWLLAPNPDPLRQPRPRPHSEPLLAVHKALPAIPSKNASSQLSKVQNAYQSSSKSAQMTIQRSYGEHAISDSHRPTSTSSPIKELTDSFAAMWSKKITFRKGDQRKEQLVQFQETKRPRPFGRLSFSKSDPMIPKIDTSNFSYHTDTSGSTYKPVLPSPRSDMPSKAHQPRRLPFLKGSPRNSGTMLVPLKPFSQVKNDSSLSVDNNCTTTCQGFSKVSGKRCQRKVKPEEITEQGAYCFHHRQEMMAEKLVFLHRDVKVKYWINPLLSETTRNLLQIEMQKPISETDGPGLIYAYRLRSGQHQDTSTHALYKIGRSVNVSRRMYQWGAKCGILPELIEVFPAQPYKTIAKICACASRAERLIHIELGERYRVDLSPCIGCGEVHREWFRVERGTGKNRLRLGDREVNALDREAWKRLRQVIVHWVRYVDIVMDQNKGYAYPPPQNASYGGGYGQPQQEYYGPPPQQGGYGPPPPQNYYQPQPQPNTVYVQGPPQRSDHSGLIGW